MTAFEATFTLIQTERHVVRAHERADVEGWEQNFEQLAREESRLRMVADRSVAGAIILACWVIRAVCLAMKSSVRPHVGSATLETSHTANVMMR
jgi:hypothetical protein